MRNLSNMTKSKAQVLEPVIEYEGTLFTKAELPVTAIDVPKERFASVHDAKSTQALKTSVRILPLINEIGVLKKGKRFELIYGGARLYATVAQGGKTIEAKIWKVSEGQALMMQIVENYARGTYDKVALMDTFARLIDEYKWKQKDIAHMLGIGEDTVSKILAVRELEPEIKEMLTDNEISFDIAVELKRIPPENKRVIQAQHIAAQHMSRDEVRSYIKHDILAICDICGKKAEGKTLKKVGDKFYCPKDAPPEPIPPLNNPAEEAPKEPMTPGGKQAESTPPKAEAALAACEFCGKEYDLSKGSTIMACPADGEKINELRLWYEKQTGHNIGEVSYLNLQKNLLAMSR